MASVLKDPNSILRVSWAIGRKSSVDIQEKQVLMKFSVSGH